MSLADIVRNGRRLRKQQPKTEDYLQIRSARLRADIEKLKKELALNDFLLKEVPKQ